MPDFFVMETVRFVSYKLPIHGYFRDLELVIRQLYKYDPHIPHPLILLRYECNSLLSKFPDNYPQCKEHVNEFTRAAIDRLVELKEKFEKDLKDYQEAERGLTDSPNRASHAHEQSSLYAFSLSDDELFDDIDDLDDVCDCEDIIDEIFG